MLPVAACSVVLWSRLPWCRLFLSLSLSLRRIFVVFVFSPPELTLADSPIGFRSGPIRARSGEPLDGPDPGREAGGTYCDWLEWRKSGTFRQWGPISDALYLEQSGGSILRYSVALRRGAHVHEPLGQAGLELRAKQQ